MVMTKTPKLGGLVEEKLVDTPSWKRGYPAFHALLRKPLGWIYLSNESRDRLLRVDKKTHCSWYCQSAATERQCEEFLLDFAQRLRREKAAEYRPFQCHADKTCGAFPINLVNDNRGYFITCNLKEPLRAMDEIAEAFHEFLRVEIELAHKNYELQNFYETVHPRALALSTMHSVHRVVSSAFNLDELLPRIGRLSMQILKARGCSVAIVDDERKYLISKFSTDQKHEKAPLRKRLGRGLEGRIAQAGEIFFNRRVIGVPFIDQEVLGVIVLKDKAEGKPFTLTDLEILKILSEQTVVAIKNAKLYAETQQLTLGSIKSINELLELDFAGDNVHLPLFARLAREIGTDLGLPRRDLVDIERAVLLLDTGYVGLPKHILSKKTKLTKEEYEAVKQHPHRGAHVLQSISSLKPIIPIILHHHERYDGKGYPQGLKGVEIPMGARIVAVVDSFTAMISRRPYRKTKTVAQAISEIKQHSGTQFDPKVVASFLKIVKKLEMV